MKGKTLLCLAIVASMLLGLVMVGPVSAQATTIGVEPASIVNPSLGPGSTFRVSIWIRNVANLAGLEFKLGYNTTVLTATTITYGGIFGPSYFPLISTIDDAAGFCFYGIMEAFGEPAFTGSARAANITFSVDSVGQSVLDLYETKLGDSASPPVPIVHDVLDGSFSNMAGVQYDLTISVVGSGTTNPAPGLHTYDQGAVVPVDAIPDAGWTLDHWELDTVNVGAADPYTVTMDTDHTLTAVFVEIPKIPSVTLAKKSAWPEHHHYSIGKDEDTSNDLFAIVYNNGGLDIWVKVVFTVTKDGNGIPVGDFETAPMLLQVGAMSRCSTAFVPPSVGKYEVSAQAWADTNADNVPDTAMGKIKTFSFSVVG